MQYTTNFSLRKPQLLESANVADLNANADSIDTLLYQNRRISATEYSQNTSYSVGDLIVYENLLYKCTGATSGNWDSSKWTRTTLAAEVELAGQSGGSQVEGNPSGTATAQLEKIGIDNDIFFINDASKIIADPYDSTSTYAVGDYCIYGTLLYKCTTAVSTAEAFDSNKWTACLVTDEMGSGGGSANLHEVTQAQYDALTEAQKKNGEMYFIKDVNGDGSQFQPVIYSTEEREIGVWTDGKPLYQKTLILSNTIINLIVEVDLSSLSIDTIVDAAGEYDRIPANNDLLIYPFGFYQSNSVFSWLRTVNNNKLSYLIQQPNTEITTFQRITIKYTKTTDAAGSGTWTPQGVPAHHYSTDEQIVGTWIDGSTLYEKTFQITCNGNTTVVNHNIANLDRVIKGNFDIYNPTSKATLIIPSYEGTKSYRVYITQTEIGIEAESARSGHIITGIIQYTKTFS